MNRVSAITESIVAPTLFGPAFPPSLDPKQMGWMAPAPGI